MRCSPRGSSSFHTRYSAQVGPLRRPDRLPQVIVREPADARVPFLGCLVEKAIVVSGAGTGSGDAKSAVHSPSPPTSARSRCRAAGLVAQPAVAAQSPLVPVVPLQAAGNGFFDADMICSLAEGWLAAEAR